jgi:hypothetical protein
VLPHSIYQNCYDCFHLVKKIYSFTNREAISRVDIASTTVHFKCQNCYDHFHLAKNSIHYLLTMKEKMSSIRLCFQNEPIPAVGFWAHIIAVIMTAMSDHDGTHWRRQQTLSLQACGC